MLLIQNDIEATARRLKITTEQAEEAIRQSKSVLFEARKKRPKPHLDDKMLASWNGKFL